jgi:BTB/POZ domain
MWRSRLYSDVRIGIEGSSSAHHEGLAAVFSTHRFILVSRSDYFHNALIVWNTQKPEIRDEDQDDDRSVEPPTLMLPSPPFTPPSLHFVLGFIYTGTLIFSNRTYDLDTAFHIMRSATYISLTSLYDEVQARIVQEMMHGLFHAYVDFPEYERITGGKWGISGCRCRQCARRIPRLIEFALLDDVKNDLLQRGARRGLVGMFGEGWCNAEFVKLDKKIRDAALKGVAKRTTPLNVFPLLLAAEFALTKLNSIIDPWADTSRDMILEARRHLDHLLCLQADECFSQSEWLELMDSDGAKFEDRDHLDWIIKSIQRGFTEKGAGRLYQVCFCCPTRDSQKSCSCIRFPSCQALVSSILLRPHASDPNATMLSPTSLIRQRIEDTRTELLRWMKKRWVSIRMEGGFDNLDPWASKEISHGKALLFRNATG